MGKTFIRVVAGLFSIVVGVAMYWFWPQLRPLDPSINRIGVALISMLAVFFAAISMTKGGGD